MNNLDAFFQTLALYIFILMWPFLAGIIVANNCILKDKRDRLCPNISFAISILVITIWLMFKILPVS